MVNKIIIKDKKAHQCSECGFKYNEKKLAIECEKYCKNHRACNIEIAKYAINLKDKRGQNRNRK